MAGFWIATKVLRGRLRSDLRARHAFWRATRQRMDVPDDTTMVDEGRHDACRAPTAVNCRSPSADPWRDHRPVSLPLGHALSAQPQSSEPLDVRLGLRTHNAERAPAPRRGASRAIGSTMSGDAVWAADPRCERLDAVDDGLETHRVEEIEGVLGAGKLGVQSRVGRHRTEVLDEGSGAAAGKRAGGEVSIVSVSVADPPRCHRAGVR